MALIDVDALRRNATTSVQTMTGPQRVTLGLAAAAVVIGILMVTRLTGNVPMATLYANLDPADAADVVAELDRLGVPYNLEAGGQIVEVPADQVHSLRLNLTGQGIPGSGVGWSVLDDQGITASAFDQRVGYQRAMEGELAKTVATIDGVSSANVHLVIPERDLLSGDDRQPSASVLVVTSGNTSLAPTQVDAIVNLVASSIEGLTPDQVSVADDSGRVLAAAGDGSGVMGLESDNQLRAKRQYESTLETDLENLLAAVVGPGLAQVEVTAELDFDSVVTTTEQYQPTESAAGDQLLVSETSRSELYRDEVDLGPDEGTLEIEVPEAPAEEGAEGEEGADGDAAATTEDGVRYSLDERDTRYALDRVVTNSETAMGKVAALSVAVLLDETAIDPARVAEIEQLVQAAAGIDTGRGDLLAVTLMPLNEQFRQNVEATVGTAVPAEAASGGGLDLVGLIRTVLTGLVALVVVLLGIRMASRGPSRELEEAIREVESRPVALQAAAEGGADDDDDDIDLDAAPTEERLQALLENQSDDMADVLRTWLTEV